METVRDCIDNSSQIVRLALVGPCPGHRGHRTLLHATFVWGFVESRVNANKVNSMKEMKTRIRKEFDDIDVPMLKRVWADLECRLDYYLRANNKAPVEIKLWKCIILNLRKCIFKSTVV